MLPSQESIQEDGVKVYERGEAQHKSGRACLDARRVFGDNHFYFNRPTDYEIYGTDRVRSYHLV